MASTASRLQAAQKVRRALQLRTEGYTWPQVAEQVGYSSAQHACRAVTDYFKKVPSEDADSLRATETEHLMMLRREAMALLRATQYVVSAKGDLVRDDDGRLVQDIQHRDRAINTLVRISESLRRLHGADQPARLAVTIEEEIAIDADIDVFISEMTNSAVAVTAPEGMFVAERDETGYPVRLEPLPGYICRSGRYVPGPDLLREILGLDGISEILALPSGGNHVRP
jgi:hypothetical protein